MKYTCMADKPVQTHSQEKKYNWLLLFLKEPVNLYTSIRI